MVPRPPPSGSTRSTRTKVLLIDDDAGVRRAVTRLLDPDFIVDGADGVTSALARLASGAKYDALVVDLYMPEANGRDTLARIAAVAPALAGRAVVVTGGPTDPELADWCASLGDALVLKPARRATLIEAITRQMNQHDVPS